MKPLFKHILKRLAQAFGLTILFLLIVFIVASICLSIASNFFIGLMLTFLMLLIIGFISLATLEFYMKDKL